MKVILKSKEEIREMELRGEIVRLFTSDSGEVSHYGVKNSGGSGQPIMSIWWNDYGDEYLIVDHPNPMSRDAYKARKIFFKEVEND